MSGQGAGGPQQPMSGGKGMPAGNGTNGGGKGGMSQGGGMTPFGPGPFQGSAPNVGQMNQAINNPQPMGHARPMPSWDMERPQQPTQTRMPDMTSGGLPQQPMLTPLPGNTGGGWSRPGFNPQMNVQPGNIGGPAPQGLLGQLYGKFGG